MLCQIILTAFWRRRQRNAAARACLQMAARDRLRRVEQARLQLD
jgi:hypothetical protein